MRHPWRGSALTGVAVIATAAAVGLSLAGCGPATAPVSAVGSGDPTPTNTVDSSIEPSAPATLPSGGGGTGGGGGSGTGAGSGSGSGSGGSGSGGQPDNKPPYVRDIYPDAFLTTDDETDDEVVGAIVQGHAYDPDGPDDQENTARITIDWGDGTTSDARLEGHGAFNAWHDYDLSYAGRAVTVRIVAYGHDGQTATETITLNLPQD